MPSRAWHLPSCVKHCGRGRWSSSVDSSMLPPTLSLYTLCSQVRNCLVMQRPGRLAWEPGVYNAQSHYHSHFRLPRSWMCLTTTWSLERPCMLCWCATDSGRLRPLSSFLVMVTAVAPGGRTWQDASTQYTYRGLSLGSAPGSSSSRSRYAQTLLWNSAEFHRQPRRGLMVKLPRLNYHLRGRFAPRTHVENSLVHLCPLFEPLPVGRS